MYFFQTSILLLLLMSTISCAAPSGLVKTQLDQWEVIKFDALGVKCELPQQRFGKGGYYIKESTSAKAVAGAGFKQIRISLHPVWYGSYLAEPFYLIEIIIIKVTEKNYEKSKRGVLLFRSYDQFRDTPDVFHSKTTEYSVSVAGYEGRATDKLIIFNKDYRVPNGDYILCGASINVTPGSYLLHTTLEINAVKKILESVEFLKVNSDS